MSVRVFRGVPYARAARFGAPEPVAWDGARDMARNGPIGPQPPSRLRAAMGDFDLPQSEDCLSLTIFAPESAGPWPVILWLHGGAYLSGAGSLPWYDGSALARSGAVVVGVNYRLGPLGMLHVPGAASGDMLLRDIEVALDWVRANVAAFGGDPGCITLMGQSAGAHAIMCLLCRGTTGFQRAVLLSPPPAWAPLSEAEATERGRHFAAELGADPRQAPMERMLEAQGKMLRAMARFGEVLVPFLPTVDGVNTEAAFIEATARTAAEQGIELIIGTTRDEMMAFFAVDPAMQDPEPAAVAACFARPAGGADAIEAYRARRAGANAAWLVSDVATDHLFRSPSLRLADAVAARGGYVFLYRFDWGPSRFGACHCIELPFVFGTTGSWEAPMLSGGDPNEMRALSELVREMIAGFARTGRPVSALPWPAYKQRAGWTMVFDSVVGVMGLKR